MARVLIVDDERSIRLTFGEFLKAAGHKVILVEDAYHARDIMQKDLFDVVVTDIVMPGISGMQLLEDVHAVDADVQVILMSGEPTIETATEAVRDGAADYLWKPVTRDSLLRSVERSAKTKALMEEKRRLEVANQTYQQNLERLIDERTQELFKTNVRLQEVQGAIIQAMTTMVEIRDAYTAGHQKRVADLACAIAQEIHLQEDQINGIRIAGVIHDLGKIVVPSEILCKSGPIGAAEFHIIRSHVEVGYEILKNIRFPWPIAETVLQHHERIDGSGYPQKLSGDNILIEARIIGVSDVVEAMAAHRPYRPARGITEALDEVSRNSGKLFDPVVADACVRLFTENRFSFN